MKKSSKKGEPAKSVDSENFRDVESYIWNPLHVIWTGNRVGSGKSYEKWRDYSKKVISVHGKSERTENFKEYWNSAQNKEVIKKYW